MLAKEVWEQICAFQNEGAWKDVLYWSEQVDPEEEIQDSTVCTHIYFSAYMAHYYLNQFEEAAQMLQKFDELSVTEHVVHNTNYLFDKLFHSIVATCDLEREPRDEKEVVIYYGNFPLTSACLPVAKRNKIYRHPMFFTSLRHTQVESNPCWNAIGQIYILNLRERRDRYYETLVELTRMHAPLDRIFHFQADKVSVTHGQHPYIDSIHGAGENHIFALQHAIDHNYEHVLILEDDFTFTSNVKQHQTDLKDFFQRQIPYDVCFLGYSKEGKIRRLAGEHGNLLSQSFLACTTTSAYLVNRASVQKIVNLMRVGQEMLLEYHHGQYACDRYWTILQANEKHQMYVFNRKLGYQRPNYSSITRQVECHFD